MAPESGLILNARLDSAFTGLEIGSEWKATETDWAATGLELEADSS